MNDFDDEKFMNQFNNRLNLEPSPKWILRKAPFPWLEIGWGVAGAMLLTLYWTELSWGFFSLKAIASFYVGHVSPKLLFMGLALAGGLTAWLAPKIVKEL